MTASRTRSSRRLSSSDAISAKLVTTSNQCQVGGQGIEPQPPEGRQAETMGRIHGTPPGLDPRTRAPCLGLRNRQAVTRSKSEIHGLCHAILRSQYLTLGDWICALGQTTQPLSVG